MLLELWTHTTTTMLKRHERINDSIFSQTMIFFWNLIDYGIHLMWELKWKLSIIFVNKKLEFKNWRIRRGPTIRRKIWSIIYWWRKLDRLIQDTAKISFFFKLVSKIWLFRLVVSFTLLLVNFCVDWYVTWYYCTFKKK